MLKQLNIESYYWSNTFCSTLTNNNDSDFHGRRLDFLVYLDELKPRYYLTRLRISQVIMRVYWLIIGSVKKELQKGIFSYKTLICTFQNHFKLINTIMSALNLAKLQRICCHHYFCTIIDEHLR